MTTASFESLYTALLAGSRDVSDIPSSPARRAEEDRDRALVVRVRGGDTAAFTVLVEHYLERVTRFANSLIGAWDVAEDLVQSVFVSIWEHRATLDPERSFQSYLFRAIRNRIQNERTAEQVRRRYEAEVQASVRDERAPSATPEPQNLVLAESDLDAFLRQLPERRQTAIRLRYDVGMNYAEVGNVMGISAPAAMQLVLRGLDDLRRLLGV